MRRTAHNVTTQVWLRPERPQARLQCHPQGRAGLKGLEARARMDLKLELADWGHILARVLRNVVSAFWRWDPVLRMPVNVRLDTKGDTSAFCGPKKRAGGRTARTIVS
jgi:hypothetical protein